MNKSELVEKISDQSGVNRKDVETSLNTMFDVVADSVKRGEDVTVQGWIKFERVNRKARVGHNPQTGEKMQIPASTATKVSALAKLKAAGKGAL